MSQVDDWSDEYTSDYLRDLNTHGPASANVPRSSVVSHQVRYRTPDTSDIPLAPGQNPEGSVYSNASGARMGQTKPSSGYRAPAGGGWDVNSSDTNLRFSNESGGKRYARPKRTQSRSRGSAPANGAANGAKTSSAPLSGTDVTAAVMKAVKADGNTSFANWRQSLVNQGWDGDPSKIKYDPSTGKFMDTGGGQAAPAKTEGGASTESASHRQSDFDWGKLNGQALDAAARFLPALRLLSGFGVGADPADTESSSLEDQFKNTPWYEDVKAHDEAVKKNMDDHGFALGTLKSAWDDIPWLAKLVMLPPVFKAGSAAAGASTTGNIWAAGSRAAAGDATAGTKAFEESLSRMNGGAVRGAPVEGTARRSFSSAGTATGAEAAGTAGREAATASASWRTGEAAEYPAGTGKFDQFGGWGESGRSAVGTGSAPASDGAAKLGEQTVSYKGSVAPGAAGAAGREAAAAGGQAVDWTSSLAQQLRAAGIPEDQIAAAIARINAGAAGREAAAAGREAAAAGREAAAAGEQAAGREAATASEAAAGREAATSGEAAADGGVSELANAGNAGRVERVPSLDISMAPSDSIYSAIDKFVMDHPGGASAVQDAIEYVTGKAPAIEHVIETLQALPRNQLEQVFMDLRGVGLH